MGILKRQGISRRKTSTGWGLWKKDETPFRFGALPRWGELYGKPDSAKSIWRNYRRILSLDSAMAVVQFYKDGIRYQRKYFHILSRQRYGHEVYCRQRRKNRILYLAIVPTRSKSHLEADGNDGLVYTGVLNNNGMKFAFRIKAIHKGGTLKAEKRPDYCEGCWRSGIPATADTDYKMNFAPDFKGPKAYVGNDPSQTTLAMMDNTLKKGYDELYRNHEADYTALFNRVRLNQSGNRHQPADLQTTG